MEHPAVVEPGAVEAGRHLQHLLDSDEARTLRPLQAAACTHHIAFGPRAGQKVLKLKTASRDRTTHLVMSRLEFMQRLAALVPRPRLHLIRLVSASLRCAK